MKEPPNRSHLTKIEQVARRFLGKSKDQELRKFCKSVLRFAERLDEYVESLYPGFQLLEDRCRLGGNVLKLESDGVWRLRSLEQEILITGTSLKDLLVNVVLWDSDWDFDEDFEEDSQEEDEIFEPDRRKNPKNDGTSDV